MSDYIMRNKKIICQIYYLLGNESFLIKITMPNTKTYSMVINNYARLNNPYVDITYKFKNLKYFFSCCRKRLNYISRRYKFSDWETDGISRMIGCLNELEEFIISDVLFHSRKNLLESQEPLGEEFEKVLHDNLWGLCGS